MAISAGVVIAAGAAYQAQQTRKARKSAEAQAGLDRQALEAIKTEPEPVVPIPGTDTDAAKRSRRRSIAAQLRRRGRASTILTSQNPGSGSLGA